MSLLSARIYNQILAISTLALSAALVWFAFVYYPKVLHDYKTGKVPAQSIFKPVSATSQKFPIETTAYRIIYEEDSQTYYAFIEGKTLDVYAFNRDNAKLALKTALSTQNLCNFTILYISTENLKVPQNLKDNSDC